MKKIGLIFGIIGVACGMMACDEDESGTSENGDKQKSFSALCSDSGGKIDKDRCVCSGVTCDAGVLCNVATKQCPASGGVDSFRKACVGSGGTMKDSVCQCGEELCDAGRICGSSGACDNEQEPELSSCTNDEDGKGTCTGEACNTKKCKTEGGTPASCDGNTCGVCLNYDTKCENHADGNGVIYSCREGKWIEVKTCDQVSCLVFPQCDNPPCMHLDEEICGECVNDAFKCENGNVPEDFIYFNYDGERKTVPQGFITGFRSKCVDGRWNKLELDDHENCFYDWLPSEDPRWPTTEMNGKSIVTVWGYDYRGRHDGLEYSFAMCAENGVDCGECMYSFSYCSNGTLLNCRRGRVEREQCPDNECATGNSCFTSSVKAYCNGYQCQNCKSICNW